MEKQDAYLRQQDILDHAKNPRNYGLISSHDFLSEQYNPSCGDRIIFCGSLKDDMLTEVRFEGKGCMLSLAMASKLTIFAKNKPLSDVLALNEDIVKKLLGIDLGLNRMQCGTLPLLALCAGIRKIKG